jgi:hypothetical protein
MQPNSPCRQLANPTHHSSYLANGAKLCQQCACIRNKQDMLQHDSVIASSPIQCQGQ